MNFMYTSMKFFVLINCKMFVSHLITPNLVVLTGHVSDTLRQVVAISLSGSWASFSLTKTHKVQMKIM